MRNSFIEVFGAVMCVFVSNYTQGMDRFLSKYEKTNDKLEYSLEEKEAIASALENIPETDPKYPLEKKDIASASKDIDIINDKKQIIDLGSQYRQSCVDAGWLRFFGIFDSKAMQDTAIHNNHYEKYSPADLCSEIPSFGINQEDQSNIFFLGFGTNLKDSSNNVFLNMDEPWLKHFSERGELCSDVDESSPLPGTPYFLFPFHSSKDRKVSFAFKDGKIFAKEEGKGGAPKVSYMPGESSEMQPPEPNLKSPQTFKTQLL